MSENKRKRNCPALNGLICSVCCGTKRLKEIDCTSDCLYLESGIQFQRTKEIDKIIPKEIRNTFQHESDDIYRNDRVVFELVEPFERPLAARFYADESVNDDDLYVTLGKVYMYFTHRSSELNAIKAFEKEIVENINTIFNKSSLSDDINSLAILRIVRSYRKISGGIFSNRNYLKFLHHQFSIQGIASSILY